MDPVPAGAPEPSTRWPELQGALVVLSAFVAIGLTRPLLPVRSYGVLFIAVFAWIGLHHRPRTAWKALPVLLPAYVIPLLGATPGFDARALALTAGTGVFVAEAIASGRRRAAAAEGSALRIAAAFRTVATTSASLQRLDPHAVLDAVVDGVMALGYDAANLAMIDDASQTFFLAHPRGISTQLGTERLPLGNGMTAQVRASGLPVVVDDYATWTHAIDFYRDCGIRAMIGVPILTDGHLVGVLVASTAHRRTIPIAEQDPLVALAAVAGAALANVERYQMEQHVAEEQRHAALTDALTGLANRRHADEVLERLAAGATIVLIDLDHFGRVNERLGHSGGDDVLRAVSASLAAGLREHDFLARFGGEELLLVLPGSGLQAAVVVVERLAAAWRATEPATTFSAGVAHHHGGDPSSTLRRADAALYEAKRGGRDRCVAAGDGSPRPAEAAAVHERSA
jgi:diguanylate cyclase (GGDEF)-like protein